MILMILTILMKLNSEKLDNLRVETQSGDKLGQIESFNLETDSQSILEYKIKPSNIVAGLIKDDFIINRGQVLEISDKKMVVDDNLVIDRKKLKSQKEKNKQKVVQGAVMKK